MRGPVRMATGAAIAALALALAASDVAHAQDDETSEAARATDTGAAPPATAADPAPPAEAAATTGTASPVPVALVEQEPALPALVVSIPIMALSSNAFAIQAERPLRKHASAVVAVGIRDGADGSYQSTTGSIGGELRFWLTERPRGLFAGPRFEASLVHMSRSGDSLGTMVSLTEGLIFGYRLVIVDRVEVSAILGYGLRHDLPTHGIPAATRATAMLGLTLGWVFE